MTSYKCDHVISLSIPISYTHISISHSEKFFVVFYHYMGMILDIAVDEGRDIRSKIQNIFLIFYSCYGIS